MQKLFKGLDLDEEKINNFLYELYKKNYIQYTFGLGDNRKNKLRITLEGLSFLREDSFKFWTKWAAIAAFVVSIISIVVSLLSAFNFFTLFVEAK